MKVYKYQLLADLNLENLSSNLRISKSSGITTRKELVIKIFSDKNNKSLLQNCYDLFEISGIQEAATRGVL